MDYKGGITASINMALRRKLKKELRDLSEAECKLQHSNIKLTMKRRHCEDLALAKELGCTIQELTE
jgi:hypothetical protein